MYSYILHSCCSRMRYSTSRSPRCSAHYNISMLCQNYKADLRSRQRMFWLACSVLTQGYSKHVSTRFEYEFTGLVSHVFRHKGRKEERMTWVTFYVCMSHVARVNGTLTHYRKKRNIPQLPLPLQFAPTSPAVALRFSLTTSRFTPKLLSEVRVTLMYLMSARDMRTFGYLRVGEEVCVSYKLARSASRPALHLGLLCTVYTR